MKSKDVIQALKRKFRTQTDIELAKRLGLSIPNIQIWKNKNNVTVMQISNLVAKACASSAKYSLANVIHTIAEFYKIPTTDLHDRNKFEIFRVSDGKGHNHPYRMGLKDVLGKSHGIYIFYDSLGRGIYAGKAKRQSLWKEMNLTFNRNRKSAQSLMRVTHPENRVRYKTAEEKSRQIKPHEVPLHEIAAYFSAYSIAKEMIDELESLLVRSFANDLSNVRMERLGRQRKKLR